MKVATTVSSSADGGDDGTGASGAESESASPVVPIIIAAVAALLVGIGIGLLAGRNLRAPSSAGGDGKHRGPGVDNPTYGETTDGFGFDNQSDGYLKVEQN